VQRMFPLTISLIVAILLSSCAPAAPAPGAPTTSPPAAAEGDYITITFGGNEHSRAKYEPLIDRFNTDNPDVQVQFVALDAQLAQAWAEAAPGRPPDSFLLAQSADTFVGVSIAPRYAYDLAPFIAADPTFNQVDFYPRVQERFHRDDGAVYAIPATLSVDTLAYNKDLFAELGIAPPTDTWTWTEMRTAAEQLARRDGQTVARYGLFVQGSTALAGELATHAPDLVHTSFAPAHIDTPATADTLAHVARLVEEAALFSPPQTATDTLDTIAIGRLVSEGTIGMWDTGLVTLPETVPFAVGVIPLNVPALFLFASTNYAMSRGTQHPDAAWRWVSFLSQQYLPNESRRTTDQIPARASVAAAADFGSSSPPTKRQPCKPFSTVLPSNSPRYKLWRSISPNP
jgi:ABC-type glycerol-3-phosphate transport system substrate-binding protein